MLRLAKALWNDQAGFIVSAELVLISSVGIIGLVTGLTCLRDAVNKELSDVSCAISALDQSYCYTGFHGYKDKCSCRIKARTAGSTNVRVRQEPELPFEVDRVPVDREHRDEFHRERGHDGHGEHGHHERHRDQEQERSRDKHEADMPDVEQPASGVNEPHKVGTTLDTGADSEAVTGPAPIETPPTSTTLTIQ